MIFVCNEHCRWIIPTLNYTKLMSIVQRHWRWLYAIHDKNGSDFEILRHFSGPIKTHCTRGALLSNEKLNLILQPLSSHVHYIFTLFKYDSRKAMCDHHSVELFCRISIKQLTQSKMFRRNYRNMEIISCDWPIMSIGFASARLLICFITIWKRSIN